MQLDPDSGTANMRCDRKTKAARPATSAGQRGSTASPSGMPDGRRSSRGGGRVGPLAGEQAAQFLVDGTRIGAHTTPDVERLGSLFDQHAKTVVDVARAAALGEFHERSGMPCIDEVVRERTIVERLGIDGRR